MLDIRKKMLNYIYWKVEKISSSKPKQIQTTKIRRPPMRITNFIKNYPLLVFSIIILLICFSLLAMPQKIYALTKSSNNPNCECKTRDCPNNSKPSRACSLDHGYAGYGRCICNLGENDSGGKIQSIETFGNCSTSTVKRCVRIKGCSNCTPTDCDPNNPCVGDGICKDCTTYRIVADIGNCDDIRKDLSGYIISCGNCNVEVSKKDINII